MRRTRRKGPWWVEQVRVAPTKKLTLGLIASEQPRVSAFRTQPQMPHRAPGATKLWPPPTPPRSSPASPASTHAGLHSVPQDTNPLPPQDLCTCYSTYLRAWHTVGLKKCLVMNGEGKGPASPRGLSRGLGRSAAATMVTTTCADHSGDRVLAFPASQDGEQ